jgi:small-conductance mechanosensitive channel
MFRSGPRITGTVTADFRVSAVAGLSAVVDLGATASLGDIHDARPGPRVICLVGSALFLVLSTIAVRHSGNEMNRILAPRVGAPHASVMRMLVNLSGFTIVLLSTLGLLSVPIQHLLLGGALTGVILGIAAQQALGNVFAGLVLLLARPFNVGDAIRIRSGSLGGELLGRVIAMGLTYVTLDTADGVLSVPNNLMLAAGIGPQPDPAADSLRRQGL